MTRIDIPRGAVMRMKSKGRYVYARNQSPIVWSGLESIAIKLSERVYTVAWNNSQGRLMASGFFTFRGDNP